MGFSALSPSQFEELTLCLVEAMDFKKPELLGGPGDKGRDIRAYPEIIQDDFENREWIFQCKNCQRITKLDINKELANFEGQNIDTWVLVTPIKPTPGLRDWFDDLNKTKNFYIKAWWKNDLDRLVSENIGYLNNRLPKEIKKIIELDQDFGLPPHRSFEKIISRCRYQVVSQIEHFARGKYIPKLYVNRSLQNQIDASLANEKHSASSSKNRSLKTLARALKLFDDLIAGKGDVAYSFKKTFLEIKKDSKKWIKRTKLNILRAITTTKSLSDKRIFGEEEKIQEAVELIKNLNIEIDSAPFIKIAKDKTGQLLSGNEVSRFKTIFRRASSEIDSLNTKVMVINDRAGSGKTNLICHMAEDMAKNRPTLLLFGKENYQGSEGLIKSIQTLISDLLDEKLNDPITELDKILFKKHEFLTIFIDGINENRLISQFDQSINTFLLWSVKHRIKVVLSCRDIYCEFFHFYNNTGIYMKIIHGELDEFSKEEYNLALTLYLKHYGLKCTLSGKAKEACQHPLLLRFFCEAYGQVGGKQKNIGEFLDIRLKELFTEYVNKKTDQIRKSLGYRSSEIVFKYLYNLIEFMLEQASAVILSSQVEQATGDPNITTRDSLYVHLLDEDIILEEQPSDVNDISLVSFVYEEFMEFLIARYLLKTSKNNQKVKIEDIFQRLDKISTNFINARGVGEYVGLMLIGEDLSYCTYDGIKFLNLLAINKKWKPAFWSVVSKIPENRISNEIFDLFSIAFDALSNQRTIKQVLAPMSRLSRDGSDRLATAILWSGALPKVLSWSDLEFISNNNKEMLNKMSIRLVSSSRNHKYFSVPGKIDYNYLLNGVLPYLNERAGRAVEKAKRNLGGPGMRCYGSVNLLKLICMAFPKYQPLLVNGLLCDEHAVRELCAERLKLIGDIYLPQIHYLCKNLLAVEDNEKVKYLLKDSVIILEQRMR